MRSLQPSFGWKPERQEPRSLTGNVPGESQRLFQRFLPRLGHRPVDLEAFSTLRRGLEATDKVSELREGLRNIVAAVGVATFTAESRRLENSGARTEVAGPPSLQEADHGLLHFYYYVSSLTFRVLCTVVFPISGK